MNSAACRISNRGCDRGEAGAPGIEIRVWMQRHRIRPIEVARALEIDPSAVTHWVNGRIRSQRIEAYMAGLGCPGELLERLRLGK